MISGRQRDSALILHWKRLSGVAEDLPQVELAIGREGRGLC